MQRGIFNDESADWTEDEAVEAGFYSREELDAESWEAWSNYLDGDGQRFLDRLKQRLSK